MLSGLRSRLSAHESARSSDFPQPEDWTGILEVRRQASLPASSTAIELGSSPSGDASRQPRRAGSFLACYLVRHEPLHWATLCSHEAPGVAPDAGGRLTSSKLAAGALQIAGEGVKSPEGIETLDFP
jgi:hypothetical protein